MNFHVRLVSAPDRTDVLLEALGSDPGVSSLVVLPGAARRPGGDAVQFDVRPGSANSIFRHLKTLQDGHTNSVAVEYVGSAFQLLLNVVLLIGVGAAALRVQRIIWRARERPGPGPSGVAAIGPVDVP